MVRLIQMPPQIQFHFNNSLNVIFRIFLLEKREENDLTSEFHISHPVFAFSDDHLRSIPGVQ